MELGIEKCAMQIRKNGRRETTERKQLPNEKESERLQKSITPASDSAKYKQINANTKCVIIPELT